MQVGLIQLRVKPDILAEEKSSFISSCDISEDSLSVLNPILGDLRNEDSLGIDAFLIGGSGAFSVTKDYEWTDQLIDFLQHVFDSRIPVFGSCWGHQFLARALGGKVIHDTSQSEMGTHSVQLTPEGKTDVLFSSFPETFLAQQGHQDRVSELPPNCVELATSAVAPNQAFRSTEYPVYGTQFHPELSAENERNRLDAYRKSYPHLNEAEFQQVYDSVEDTPEVSSILSHFMDLVDRGLL